MDELTPISTRGWAARQFIGAGVLVAASMLAALDAWRHIFGLALEDSESSYILSVPFLFAWLVWVRRERLRDWTPHHQWIGTALVAAGWAASSYGYRARQHMFWGGGAVLMAAGAVLTVGGAGLLTRFLPAFGALVFLVPVWPFRQAQVAGPLQAVTARLTEAVCEILGMQIERQGHLLISNGVNVAVAEACNGMRLVFTLILVIYAYAFMTPRRPWQRITILLASPLVAIACNVIRLVPTVWVFGHASAGFAETFHDVTGWVMLGVAFVLLMGIARLLALDYDAGRDGPARDGLKEKHPCQDGCRDDLSGRW